MNKVTLAYKYEGEYFAQNAYDSVDNALSNAELEDVINHEYQIWDLETDKVYELKTK